MASSTSSNQVADTSQLEVPRTNVEFTVNFYTISGVYPVIARTTYDFSTQEQNSFNNGLINFQTQNDAGNGDAPSFTIELNDTYEWDNVLSPNDYIRIDAKVWSELNAGGYQSSSDVQTSTLMTGLISSITKATTAGSNERVYTVSGQGMAKVALNLNLDTFSELTSSLSGYQMIPDEEKKGIRFSQRTSANIIQQVWDKFVLNQDGDFINYNYYDGSLMNKLTNLIKLNLQENRDESMMTGSYNQYQNPNMSVYKMIDGLSAKPFNEYFWTHEDGVATFTYRPTPYDPENWNALEVVSLSPEAIISDQTNVTDEDQASIFKILAYSGYGSETYSGGWSGHLAPLTNLDLIQHYMYKIMEINCDYFNGNKGESEKNSEEINNTNINLSSKVKSYYSLAKKVCDDKKASDWLPYVMAILQQESKNAGKNDIANTKGKLGKESKTKKKSIENLVDYLKSGEKKGNSLSPKVTDKLSVVNSYQYNGDGFLDKESRNNDASFSLNDAEEYAKSYAKKHGNPKATTSKYLTTLSRKYGKEYQYKNGGNFYYALEVKSYLGSTNDNAPQSSSNSTTPSSEGTTEKQASLHYPPYASLENAFNTAKEGKKKRTESEKKSDAQLTIPEEYGGTGEYKTVLGILKGSGSKSSKLKEIQNSSSGHTHKISKGMADLLYSKYKVASTKDKLPVSGYLSVVAPNYNPTNGNLARSTKYLKSNASIKAHPKKAALELMSLFNYTLGSKQAYEIIKAYINNGYKLTPEQYAALLKKYGYNETESGVNPETSNGASNGVPYLFRKYTEKLFNWFADESKYHSGDIIVSGILGVEIGKRLRFYDKKLKVYWEYYIEGVSHSFDYSTGQWTTDIGVTRGIALDSVDDDRRFTNPWSYWGLYTEFKGGYFGEPTMAQDEATYASSDNSSDDSDDGGSTGGAVLKGKKGKKAAADAAAFGYSKRKSVYKNEVYSEYHRMYPRSSNPLDKKSGKIVLDCSSFVYWCFKKQGVTIGANTGEDMSDSHFKHMGNIPTSKMLIGDCLELGRGGNPTHIVMYIGGGKTIGWNGDDENWDPKGGAKVVTVAFWRKNKGIVTVLRLK